jgi:hypothetical protein
MGGPYTSDEMGAMDRFAAAAVIASRLEQIMAIIAKTGGHLNLNGLSTAGQQLNLDLSPAGTARHAWALARAMIDGRRAVALAGSYVQT